MQAYRITVLTLFLNVGLLVQPGATYGQTPLSFSWGTNFTTGAFPVHVAVADLDSDGNLDVVTSNFYPNTTASVLLGNGDGTFRPRVDYQVGPVPYGLVIADTNHDNKLDLVVTNRDINAVSILKGNGDGTFQARVAFTTGAAPVFVIAEDFNRDGRLDLATANLLGTGTVSILVGNGDGSFQPPTSYVTASYSYSVTAGDFDLDGKLDVATANYLGNTISVLKGNGDGSFQPQSDLPAPAPQSVITADVDGDEILDLVATHTFANEVAVFLGNGDGTFQAPAAYATGAGPAFLHVADLNGDGVDDVAVPSYYANAVTVLGGAGDGTFPTRVDYSTASGPFSAAAGDFDEDGAIDLVIANNSSSNITLLLGARPQSITFLPLADRTFGEADFTVGASASSGLPVIFSVGTSDDCVINGSVVTITGAGSCSVTAHQSGNSAYRPAPDVTRTFGIAPAAATLSLSDLVQAADGTPKQVIVTTTPIGLSGITILYDGSFSAPTNAGSYSVVASLNNPNYVALDAVGTLVLSAATPAGSNIVASSIVGTSTITTAGNVAVGGATTVVAIDPSTAGDTPGGFQIFGSSFAFEVTTTATYSGLITTCFTLSSISSEVVFNSLRILHREIVTSQGSTTYQLIDRTILNGADRPNFATRRICAKTSSLSPFVVAVVTDLSPPSLTEVTLSQNPAAVGTSVALTITASELASGSSDIASVEYSVDGGVTWSTVVADYHATSELTATVSLVQPVGVYSICARATDAAQNTTASCDLILAVYDPAGGYVTGGGWIVSPPGAYAVDPLLSGKATFGFVSKYQSGATPVGNTHFQFQAGGLNFRSTSYEWLVVAGTHAQFKGIGTLNGTGAYQFLLTAIDGQTAGSPDGDAFRIKINGPGGLIYDSSVGSPEFGGAATELSGGNIHIHR